MRNKEQIFCFTYAGGTAAFFDDLEKDLPGFEFVKLEYSGHGPRRKEPFYADFNALADDLYPAVKARRSQEDYALLGYSMGVISVVEILKRILADPAMKPPKRVFLAAHEPHTRIELQGFAPDELDEWVKQRTINFGTVPAKLIDNRSFWRVYLPLFRADYAMLGTYFFEELDLRTGIPATVFYSETDTPRADMELWRRYFVGDCSFHEFSGTHFFIQQHHREMARIISDNMNGRGKHHDL